MSFKIWGSDAPKPTNCWPQR